MATDDHFGLRAAESLVREHGGTLEVESARASGTIVRVEVPVTMIRVVVADDHAVVRRGLDRLIESTDDLEVVGVARDGSEAVDLVREHRPDVAVMDLQMPVLDGVEATRAIVGEATGTEVLVLTSFSDRARIDAAIEAGAVGYLLKDAEPEVLLDGIRAVAGAGRPSTPGPRGGSCRGGRPSPPSPGTSRSPRCHRARRRCCGSWSRACSTSRSPSGSASPSAP